MPDTIGAPNPNPNSNPNKRERAPLLKKSKIISDKILFPAASHVSSTPLSSARFSSESHNTYSTSTSESINDAKFGFGDRDYVYPSFLGPHTTRSRVNVKSTSKSQRNQLELRDSMPSAKVESKMKPKPKLKAEKDFNALSVQISNPASSALSGPTSANSSNARRASGHRYSWILYLLKFVCTLSVSHTVYLRNEVSKLQEENISLRRVCSHVDLASAGIKEFEEVNSLVYFSTAGSRTGALYMAVFILVIPFALYKYLDYLPRIIDLLKRKYTKKEEVPLKKRIAYVVDVCFSNYPYAKLLALLFSTLFLIGYGGLALYAVGDGSFTEAIWLSWSFVADSGNHAEMVGAGPRIVSVLISSGGMLIFAMMLGLVSDAISEKVDSLRKGKSEVIESNHILVLGWSDKLGSLLKQLAIANKSIGGGVVVVLAERDKEEMEMDIAKLEFDFMGTSVICRSGSPLILADLKKVSVSKARAIIVLASDENADQSDARALRVVLSLTGVREGLRGHVVVEMSDLDNEPLVKLVGGELIETVVAHDVIGRLMIQCALQPGLAQIWEDILGFENAEFYIKRWPQLDGAPFKDVLVLFPEAIPCGVKVAADGGKIIINPDDRYVLKEGDEVLVIAEDDDTYAPGLLPEVLEALLAPGSELWMFNEVPEKDREKKLTDGGLDISGLENIKLVHHVGNAVIRRHLEGLPLETFDSILILADESVEDSIVHSDSRSLATLLLIRDIQSKRLPNKDSRPIPLRHSVFSQSSWIREMQQASDRSIIISEILDSRTRNLVSVSRISDYVLSNELVSMALAMVAEDKQINRVLEELFAEEGNELCIKPAEFYLYEQEELCFYEIMRRGRQRREIVIGYRIAAAERAVINPAGKSKQRKWSLDDVFVVISSGD
ncbi:ion channel POLLUX isoform X3 [Capsicum annuum]|uniref:ion channel POLLUX isoform X3 n=1 Tax=Capsicum annuum TaxID=4072 RepID=UPI001FB0E6BD|nr:ion channel POLLUX isoform X3 [Capsicum annuum]